MEDLKSVLATKLSPQQLVLFEDADISLLVAHGFRNLEALRAASRDSLKQVLRGRLALVDVLLKGFTCSTIPSKKGLEKWLEDNPIQQGASLDELIGWMDLAPVADKTRSFIASNLMEVPGNLFVPGVIPEGVAAVFRRKDYYSLLCAYKDAKVLVVSGRRRQGKTCGIPMELLQARFEHFGVQDKALFYHDGSPDVNFSKLNTVVLLLSRMHVAACWDEFTSLNGSLSMQYKAFLGLRKSRMDKLSVVLLGSNEAEVTEKGQYVTNSMRGLGGRGLRVPEPGLDVILGIFNFHYFRSRIFPEDRWEDREISEMFLRDFTLYGYNLQCHMMYRESSEVIAALDLSELSFIQGRKFRALESLSANKGDAKDADTADLKRLQDEGYIARKVAGTGHTWVFLDPQLISYQSRIAGGSAAEAEGRVFEMMVRHPKLLLPMVAQKIGAMLGEVNILEEATKMLHGDFEKGCEIDGLFSIPSTGVMLSCKREWRDGDWANFGYHIFKLSNGSNTDGKKHVAGMKEVLCVGLSALPASESQPRPTEMQLFNLFLDSNMYELGVQKLSNEDLVHRLEELSSRSGTPVAVMKQWLKKNAGMLHDLSRSSTSNKLVSYTTPVRFVMINMRDLLKEVPPLAWVESF